MKFKELLLREEPRQGGLVVPRGLASNISWPSAARNTENTVNTCINRAILRHVSRPLLTYTTTHFYLSHDLPRGTVF
jgi:hypothetical protein